MKKQLIATLLLGFSLFVSSLSTAMEWQQLDLMRQAIQQTNYRGDYLHRRGDKTSVYSVVHRFQEGQSEELLKQLDGDMVEVLRTKEKLISFYPEGSEAALTHAVPAAPYSQVDALDLPRIADNYRASSLGMARVAGWQTHVIELTGDEWRYRHRFWLEVSTNLLLQSEIVDLEGNVLEQFRYTRIEIGQDITDAELQSSFAESGTRQQTIFKAEPRNVDDSGFLSVLNWMPQGYQLTNAIRRNEAEGWVEQRTYSDGLTSFSVFAEHKAMPSTQPMAVAKMGATTALMTSLAGLSVTVIGEVPSKTAKQIAHMLSVREATL